MIIGFTGRKGSGKDTAAQVFMARGFYLLKFASPLKEMLAQLMFQQGADEDLVHASLEGELKETPSPYLAGRTPRHAMQTLGTEWGRELMGERFWVNAFMNSAQLYKNVVVSDVRFPNEVEAIHNLGGQVFRIIRPSLGNMGDNHPSETLIDNLDVDGELINNAVSVTEFQQELDLFFSKSPAKIQ